MFVSVIIPTYNRPQQTLEAVESVLAQSYRNFELIVVDDGSAADLSVIRARLSSEGQSFLYQDNRGVASARNVGAAQARGEYLAFLDSDDRWLPDKLLRQVAFHQAHPECQVSQCGEIWYRDGVFVNPGLRHALPDGDAFYRSLEVCCVSASSVMIKRELFQAFGGFDEQLIVCEDYDLWLRLAAQHPIRLVGEQLVEKFGGHADQLSKSQIALDRFRVYTLAKLMADTELSNEQRNAVRVTLSKKINLLQQGARKRGYQDRLQLYSELKAQLETPDSVRLTIQTARKLIISQPIMADNCGLMVSG